MNRQAGGCRFQYGVAYVEYVLSTLVLMVLLFLPIPGLGISVVDIVMVSINAFYRNSAFLISLP